VKRSEARCTTSARGTTPGGAPKKQLEQKDALHAGRKPREVPAGVTVKEPCNAYPNHKKALQDVGELSPRAWKNCEEATTLLVSRFGMGRLVPDLGRTTSRPCGLDGEEVRTGPTGRLHPPRALRVQVRLRCRTAGNAHAVRAGVRTIDEEGPPARKTGRGPKAFEAAEIRATLGGRVTPGLEAMILSGVNWGFGNADCGTRPFVAPDLAGGRTTTGPRRGSPAVAETVGVIPQGRGARYPAGRPRYLTLDLLNSGWLLPWVAGSITYA
jgi:hypothetical protein